MIRIVKIEGESKQGCTQPLFCVGEDALRYVVKGKRAGCVAVTREWIAGRLAQLMGLPVPPFTLMELDPKLLEYDLAGYAKRIGKEAAFGSRYVPDVNEILLSQTRTISVELRSRILLFDWWIANSDRNLTESGGNPNLLWDVNKSELVIIDHNLAFEIDECDSFWTSHIFKDDASFWTESFKTSQSNKMRAALEKLEAIWNELPEDWIEIDVGVNFSNVERLLWRFDRDPNNFWKHP
jgi:hypothetical protein